MKRLPINPKECLEILKNPKTFIWLEDDCEEIPALRPFVGEGARPQINLFTTMDQKYRDAMTLDKLITLAKIYNVALESMVRQIDSRIPGDAAAATIEGAYENIGTAMASEIVNWMAIVAPKFVYYTLED